MDLGIEGEYSDRERGVATAGSVTIRRWWNEAPPPRPYAVRIAKVLAARE